MGGTKPAGVPPRPAPPGLQEVNCASSQLRSWFKFAFSITSSAAAVKRRNPARRKYPPRPARILEGREGAGPWTCGYRWREGGGNFVSRERGSVWRCWPGSPTTGGASINAGSPARRGRSGIWGHSCRSRGNCACAGRSPAGPWRRGGCGPSGGPGPSWPFPFPNGLRPGRPRPQAGSGRTTRRRGWGRPCSAGAPGRWGAASGGRGRRRCWPSRFPSKSPFRCSRRSV